METPLVSIITPNYNGAKFLAGTIESVRAQSFTNWEMLVVDDGSSDNSVSIVEDFSRRDPRIRPLKTTFKKVARGPGAARNTGIDQAKGRYIAFLDSDDKWRKDKLEEQIQFMSAKSAAFSFAWYDVINERDEIIGEKRFSRSEVTYGELLKDCPIGCLTAIYDTQLIGKQFIHLDPLDRFADYSLWLKILKQTPKGYCLHKPVAEYRLVSGSISANKIQAAKHQWDILTHVEKLGLVRAIYYFGWYAFKGVFSKLKFLIHRGRS